MIRFSRNAEWIFFQSTACISDKNAQVFWINVCFSMRILVEGKRQLKEQQIGLLSLSVWCGLVSYRKKTVHMFKGRKRENISMEKIERWGSVGERGARTRGMAPIYKDPTVQESHCLPMDWVLSKTKACIWEKSGKKGGEKIAQNSRRGIWWSYKVPWQTRQWNT